MGLTLRFMLGLVLLLFCTNDSVASWKRFSRDAGKDERITPATNGSSSAAVTVDDAQNVENSTVTYQPKTEHVENAVYSNDKKTNLNGAVNSNYLHAADSTRLPTKLQKSEPYNLKKNANDDNIAIESNQKKSKISTGKENDESEPESHFKDDAFPSGKFGTSSSSIGFDIKKYFSPEFHSKNNVYTISLSPESERYASPDFDEKFHTFKEPDFSSYFETTSEYTVPHDDYFDKLREEHDDFDIKLGDPELERKEKPEFDINDRFRKPTDSDRSESKDTTFNTPVDKLKKNDNDTKLDVDFVKFKRIENNGKKNKNGVRKNVVTEKRTSIDYNSSFNKTEIIGKDDNKGIPDLEPENDEFEFSDIKIHDDDPPRDTSSTLKEIVTSTHKTIVYHPTTKKSNILRKPPSSNNSHIPLLNNNIEIDLKKLTPTIKTTTFRAPITENHKAQKFSEITTPKTFITTKAPRTITTFKTTESDVKTIVETTTKSEVSTTKPPKKVATDVPSIIPLRTSTAKKVTESTTIEQKVENSSKSPIIEKETASVLQRKNSPINVSKRGSIKFNSPTTEVNRYRNNSIRSTFSTTKKPTKDALNDTTADVSDASVQENRNGYTQSARPEVQKSSVLPFLRNYNATKATENITPKLPFNIVTTLTSSSTTEATRNIKLPSFSKAVNRRPSTRRIDLPIYTPATTASMFIVNSSAVATNYDFESTITTMTTPSVTQLSTTEPVSLSSSTHTTSDVTNTESSTVTNKPDEMTTLTMPINKLTQTVSATTITTEDPTVKTTTIDYDAVSYSSEVSYSSSSSKIQRVSPDKANVSYTILVDTHKPGVGLTNLYDTSRTTEEYTPDTTAGSENKDVAVSLGTASVATTPQNSGASEQNKNDIVKQTEKHVILTTEESAMDYEDTNDDGIEEDEKKLSNPSDETDHATLVPEKFKPIEKIHNSDVEKNINDVPSETTIPLSYDHSVEVTTNFELQRPKAEGNGGTIAAITISCVGAVCLILLAVLLVLMRKRQKRFNYGQRCTPVSLDAYSMDNVSVYNSVRRKALRGSKRSYNNPAFDDPSSIAHPLNFPALAKFATNLEDIMAEFEEIPQVTARTNELPEGCDMKNRYANVIPLPETRVSLTPIEGYPNSDYINANYVTGPNGTRGYYIACQAPLQNTVDDFWRMVWEQQSKVILMLTHLYENGVEKCADYLPPSEITDCHRLFGDFQVTLKKREVKDKYIISSLQLKNMVSNSWREVTHLWYMGWPEKGVPLEANSLIAFLIEARSYIKNPSTSDNQNKNKARSTREQVINPIVVHCSPGTGRTGTVIACDIAIREFELTREVDLPTIVYRIRRDRASAVQTKEQYIFIYKVVSLYATKLAGGAFDSI